MKAIWNEESDFRGEVDIPTWSCPKPVQWPHPPILVGGNGPTAIDRVLDYGDGWMPNAGRGRVSHGIAELQRRAAEVGRGQVPVSVFGARPEPHLIEDYRAMGVERCVFVVPPVSRDEVLSLLDRYMALVEGLTR